MLLTSSSNLLPPPASVITCIHHRKQSIQLHVKQHTADARTETNFKLSRRTLHASLAVVYHCVSLHATARQNIGITASHANKRVYSHVLCQHATYLQASSTSALCRISQRTSGMTSLLSASTQPSTQPRQHCHTCWSRCVRNRAAAACNVRYCAYGTGGVKHALQKGGYCLVGVQASADMWWLSKSSIVVICTGMCSTIAVVGLSTSCHLPFQYGWAATRPASIDGFTCFEPAGQHLR